MSKIKWCDDYEALFHSVCVHCSNDGFDADSCLTAVENYIDLFFEKENGKIRFWGTDKKWNYLIQRQSKSVEKYEIILIDDTGQKICMRGDTIGTYKSILKAKIIKKQQTLSYNCLKQVAGLDLHELNFCNCKNNALYNNHSIGSFFIIPKPKASRVSLNTSRARSPYYDNFFMFLNLIKNYKKDKLTDDTFKELFHETKVIWDMMTFEQYIECMGLKPFIEDIPKQLFVTPNLWNVETINLYNKTINECINKRNILLYDRINN